MYAYLNFTGYLLRTFSGFVAFFKSYRPPLNLYQVYALQSSNEFN
jgi:hypothetical protein